MRSTRWKALYFYHVLSLLIFTCYCISCRQQSSDKISSPASTPTKETTPLDTTAALAQADSLFMIGEQLMGQSKNDSALVFHQQALDLRIKARKENSDLAKSYYKVAWLYLEDFKYDVADPYIEKARLIADQCNEVDPQLYIEIYLCNANCKVNLNDIASSISLNGKALKHVEKYFPENDPLLFRVYRSLSSCYYYTKEYGRTIDYLNKSLALVDRSDHKQLGNLYNSFGSAYRDAGDNKKALHYFNKSIEENLKWTAPDSNELAKVYVQKAAALERIGLKDSSQYFLIKNYEIRRKVFGTKNVNTFGALLSLAELEYNSGLYDSAAHHYQESLISLIRNFNNPQLSFNPIPEPTELNTDLIIGLAGKAKAIQMMSHADSGSFSLKKLSLETYLLADSVFSIFRNTSNYDDPKLKQLERRFIRYDEMTALSFELFNSIRNLKYADIALTAMERSRAVLVKNSLQKAEAYSLAGVESVFKIKELELIQHRAELIRILSASELSGKITDSLNNELLLLDADFFRFQEELKIKNPTYFASKYQAPGVRLKDLQFFLKDQNSILLEYLWSDSAIYLLKITSNEITTSVIPQTSEFRKAFHDFIDEISVGDESTTEIDRFIRFCKSAHLLYDRLVRTSLEGTPANSHLIISADGPLAIFPFEALIESVPDYREVNYHLRYLTLTHTISYTYSSDLLLRLSSKHRHGNKLLALGFGGNGSSRQKRNGLINLPGTKLEVEAIKEVMKNHTNKYLLQNEASEYVFKNTIQGFNLAHLALHGESDTLNALESRIIFRSETDTIEDGQLYAHELYDLDLSQLDMAVLSACESGIGKHQIGEGIMSMARGFAYAGCPSIVLSLWKIDDHTSAQIMKDFYGYLSEGERLDVSLSNAKGDYIRRAGEFKSHPYFWSAFLQVGNTSKMDIKKPNWWGWVFFGSLLVIVSLIIYSLIKRNTSAP